LVPLEINMHIETFFLYIYFFARDIIRTHCMFCSNFIDFKTKENSNNEQNVIKINKVIKKIRRLEASTKDNTMPEK